MINRPIGLRIQRDGAMVIRRSCAAWAMGLVFACAALSANPPRGTFTDGAGAKHRWNVNANHALVWDGDVWAPAGGVFVARSWKPGADAKDVASDLDALAKLRQAGIRDLLIQPMGDGLSAVPVARVQGLVDALEGGGFRYGIALADRTFGPTTVRQILPSRMQLPRVGLGQTARIGVDHLLSARYLVVLPSGEVVDEGEAVVADGGAYVPPKSPVAGGTAVVFPERRIPADQAPFPPLWSGFDRWRDRLITTLSAVRFGPGLRFFTDPLPPGIRLDATARSMIPSGEGAADAWATFLETKYSRIQAWAGAWKINRPDTLDTFEKAADWFPLWFDGRGIPAFANGLTGERVSADSTASTYWNDLSEFKRELLRKGANQMALAIKRGVADVPVVVRCKGHFPWGLGTDGGDSVDAVALEFDETDAARPDPALVARLGENGPSPRPLWFLTTGLRETPGRAATGFSSLESLHQWVVRLTDNGDRGFFVSDVRSGDDTAELTSNSEQLAWIVEAGRRSLARGTATLPTPYSRCVPFPNTLDLEPLLLQEGGWWLPVDRPFRTYEFGPAARAYGMTDGNQSTFVLWSSEKREVKIRIPKVVDANRLAWWPAERGTRQKDLLVLQLGPDPLRLVGFDDSLPMPLDAFESAMADAMGALRELRARREVDAARMELELSSLRTRYRSDNTQSAYTLLQTVLDATTHIQSILRPYRYLWIEGEGGGDIRMTHLFDGIEPLRGASGARVLRISAESLVHGPATATYRVNVNAPQAYRIFVSADLSARYQVRVDGRTVSAQAGARVGREYASSGLIWRDQGEVRLERGDHALEIVADGPMDLDAVMLSGSGTRPDGSIKPEVRSGPSKATR